MLHAAVSGNTPFTINVPYNLVESGPKGEKPLIVYLHGYKQNMGLFRKKADVLLSLNAYHLFLQGPYPVYDEAHKRKVAQWGRAWYLYDGEQDQFIKSLERSSAFIEQIMEKLLPDLQLSRHAILGYSMGGYLAGYFALSRPQLTDDLIVIGGRIKTEHFTNESYNDLSVLALHGSLDTSVGADAQKKSCEDLRKRGAEVIFTQIEQGHALNNAYIKEVKKWMMHHGYAS